MEKEYILFCDESDQDGRYYCNFYGGVIVGAMRYQEVSGKLEALKRNLNLFGEAKWEKVTERYLEKYIALMNGFFQEVAAGIVRVRVMFRQKARQPLRLTAEQTELGYFLLYYQFIKHAFGLEHAPPAGEGDTRLRLYFDEFPQNREKAEAFKGFLLGLAKNPKWRSAGLIIRREDIAEVRSHEHVLLQCLDIVLGAMTFRLNEKHREKPPGARVRGKRTRAKEKLYRAILEEIQKIRPGFNVGISTGMQGVAANRWLMPYCHWSFAPKQSEYHVKFTKGWSKKSDPTAPTSL